MPTHHGHECHGNFGLNFFELLFTDGRCFTIPPGWRDCKAYIFNDLKKQEFGAEVWIYKIYKHSLKSFNMWC